MMTQLQRYFIQSLSTICLWEGIYLDSSSCPSHVSAPVSVVVLCHVVSLPQESARIVEYCMLARSENTIPQASAFLIVLPFHIAQCLCMTGIVFSVFSEDKAVTSS
jgi:hypothetical protein